MTPEQKTKWLAALRSGKYVQGIGRLHCSDNNSYCCLGVAQKEFNLTTESPYELLLNGRSNEYIPVFICGEFQRQLASMNDAGKSFVEIADYIEANVEPERKTYDYHTKSHT